MQLEDRHAPAVFYVAPSGSDALGRGTSPDAPFQSIQFAVNQSSNGDTVLVAEGSYSYNAAADVDGASLGTTAVVTVFNRNVSILGGFSTDDGYARSNPQANPTIIDGQNQHRGVLLVGVNQSAAVGLELNGFTISNGRATSIPARGGLDAFFAFGGGALIDFSDPDQRARQGRVRFANVTFENNQAVGSPGNPADPQFDFGGAGSGGGLDLKFANDVVLENVVFRGNKAIGGPGNQRGGVGNGGAIHTDNSTLTATNVLFDGNQALSADSAGPGIDGNNNLGFQADGTGGAVSLQFSTGTFTRVVAVNNLARGGAAATESGDAFGGGFFAEQAFLTIRDAVIQGNQIIGGAVTSPTPTGFGEAGGAGVLADRSALTLDRVKVLNNTATGGDAPAGRPQNAGAVSGGGVYAFRKQRPNGASFPNTVSITNSLIAGNKALLGAGGTNQSSGSGAGLRLEGVDATISHTTIAGNALDPRLFFGPAIMLQNDAAITPTVLNLHESIVALNSGQAGSAAITLFKGTTLNMTQNLLFHPDLQDNARAENLGNPADPNGNQPGQINGAGTNLPPTDPLFTDRAAADFSLLPTSPAADADTMSMIGVDIGNNPRTDLPDLGGYEVGTPGSAPNIPNATGAASTTGGTPPTSPPSVPPVPPVTPGGPTRVGYRQFLAGPGAGGGDNVILYNPDRTIRATGPAFGSTGSGGVRTAAADFNADGVADLVVGTGPGTATRVRVLDGAKNLAQIFSIDPFEASFTGGVYVAAGDVTGDGVADLVITPDEGGGPRVRVFNGSGFGLITDFFGIDDPNFRGGARAAVGDVNGDKVGDLIVAAGFQGGPRIAGFDGTSLGGTPTRVFGDFFAFEETLRNGVFVAVGDLDGDGYAEVIAGGGPGGGPRVTAFSGKALLSNQYDVKANFFGGDEANRGGIRVAVKDLDGDARADVVVGAGTGAAPRVTGYLGSTIGPAGTPPELFALEPFPNNFTGGVFVG